MKVLFVNACGNREGDINVALTILDNLPQDAAQVCVASVPRGAVYEALAGLATPPVRVAGFEMGGKEAPPARRMNAAPCLRPFHRAAEAFGAAFRLAALVVREEVDLICCIDRTISPHLSAVVSRLTGVPLFLIAAYPFYGRDRGSNRWVLRTAAAVLSHSRYLTEHLSPYVTDPSRIATVLDSIDLHAYRPDADGAAARRELGIPPGAPMVLLPGRINRFKGHDDLIRAARIVAEQRPDARFVIVGREDTTPITVDGVTASFKQHLTGLIRDLGLKEHVILGGYVTDLKQVYAAADIVTMPSHEEPFGLVALEGMAMGKPVVATEAGGVPEFVLNGVAGTLVPPRNPEALAKAILDLVNDPDLRLRMGRNGRRLAEANHDSAAFVCKVSALMARTASEPPVRESVWRSA